MLPPPADAGSGEVGGWERGTAGRDEKSTRPHCSVHAGRLLLLKGAAIHRMGTNPCAGTAELGWLGKRQVPGVC